MLTDYLWGIDLLSTSLALGEGEEVLVFFIFKKGEILMKKRFMIMAVFVMAIMFVFTAGNALAALRVNVMPGGFASHTNSWDSGPYTWPGNALELWGNVSYDGTDALTYTWSFGAGEGAITGTVSNMNNIAETHTYNNTGSYIATLTVTDGTETDTDTVYIDVVPSTLNVEVNLATQRGLKYLYMKRETRTYNGLTGYTWPSYRYVAGSALAVMSFENHGHLEKNDPDLDIYAETVEGGINTLFYYLYPVAATMNNTTYTDSDINSNGKKVYSYTTNMYHVGITAMAIAATVSPAETVRNCGNNYGNAFYIGKTYQEVLEDMVDYIAYAQKEGTSGYAGGWRYSPNYSSSDNSVAQWPTLGLGEAERAPWTINAPAWVKTRLPIWINYSQYTDGGFGYTHHDWRNIAKTGAGIIEIVYAGSGGNLANAINFIASNWNTTVYDSGNIGDHYAMYAVKKGMEYANLSIVGTHDWQEEYNQWYVNNQYKSGSSEGTWPSSVRIGSDNLSCSFGLLVMAPLEVCKPIAKAGSDQEIVENTDIDFNGTSSSHTCPDNYSIVIYEWDFDYDGITFDTDATGPTPTKAGGYSITNGTDTQEFTVALMVVDNQSPPKLDSDTLVVTVTNGNVAPVADPNGPYLGGVGEDITLNGTGSYDDNAAGGANPILNPATPSGFDEIVLYQWDIDGDGLYGGDDSPADPEGETAVVNFGPIFMGTKTVGLKVTDSFGRSTAQSAQVTTVAVSDLYPVSYELTYRNYNRRTRLWTVAWKVNIKNDGNGAATDASASWTPSSVPPGVTAVDDSVIWTTPDNVIEPDEIQLSDDEFRYTYPRGDSGPDLTQITWDIEFTDALGNRHVIRSVPQ